MENANNNKKKCTNIKNEENLLLRHFVCNFPINLSKMYKRKTGKNVLFPLRETEKKKNLKTVDNFSNYFSFIWEKHTNIVC